MIIDNSTIPISTVSESYPGLSLLLSSKMYRRKEFGRLQKELEEDYYVSTIGVFKTLFFVTDKITISSHEKAVYPYQIVLPLKKLLIPGKAPKVVIDLDESDKNEHVITFIDPDGNIQDSKFIRDDKEKIQDKSFLDSLTVSYFTDNDYKIYVYKRSTLKPKGFADPFIDHYTWLRQRKTHKVYWIIILLFLASQLYFTKNCFMLSRAIGKQRKQIATISQQLTSLQNQVTQLKRNIENPDFSNLLRYQEQLMNTMTAIPGFLIPKNQSKEGLVFDIKYYSFLPDELRQKVIFNLARKEFIVPYHKKTHIFVAQ